MYTPQVAFNRSAAIPTLVGGTPGPVEAWRFGYNVVVHGHTSIPVAGQAVTY